MPLDGLFVAADAALLGAAIGYALARWTTRRAPVVAGHDCHYAPHAHESLNGTPRTCWRCARCGDRYWQDDR